MNALANDQRNRVRALLAGTGVTFGRYTGETQLMAPRPPGTPEEERVTRGEFRTNPPDLLLTNYQMLEYMLLRGDGREILRNHRVRFVVLDEVHTYHGALGVDLACLMRRLRAALEAGRPGAPPLFIGTSATLQSGDEAGDPRPGVATFFRNLTGQEIAPEAVLVEDPLVLERPAGLRFQPAPEIREEDLQAFDPEDSDAVTALANRLAGIPSGRRESLEEAWQKTPLPYLLLHWLTRPRSLHEVVALLAQEEGRRLEADGVTAEALAREVEAALLVGPCLPEDHPLRLRPRVHRFFRGLARFWRCTNPECGRLLGEGIEICDACGARSLPLALCRTCGWDFFMAHAPDGETAPLASWPWRRSGRQTVFVFDPPLEPVEVEPEEDPLEPGGEGEGDGEGNEDNGGEEAPAAAARGAADAYLCSRCLTYSREQGVLACGCPTAEGLRPVRVHRGRGTRCPVCQSRYGRFDILTPVRLGNSLALSHLSRMIMRGLPPDRRKLLVFCDSRQDAAHQARFIAGIEGHLRARRAIHRLLREDGAAHDVRWLVDGLLDL